MARREKTFGERLKTARELQKLSQTELAQLAGLTPAAISQLEADDRQPALKTLTKLAAALETSASFLLGEEKPELPQEMKILFRDLQDLGADDFSKVRDYAAYLRVRSRSKG